MVISVDNRFPCDYRVFIESFKFTRFKIENEFIISKRKYYSSLSECDEFRNVYKMNQFN